MNGNSYLLDSNIIIYLLNGTLLLKDIAKNNDTFYVSVVTYMEVLGFPFSTEEAKNEVETFLNSFILHHLTAEIVQKTVCIKQQRRIKLPDAIIAATALCKDITVVTRNTSDFKNIPSLRYYNPFE